MEELLKVPEDEEIGFLYSVIKKNPSFLKQFDETQLVDTPLHLAAARGRTQLALEIQMLMPSFGRKLNPDGFSPIHLAMQRAHFDTVFAMIKLDPELVCVKGREGFTPLHYAAETDNVDMLGEFLLRCPDAIHVLTLRGESAVHVAVKNGKLAAFILLFQWLTRSQRTEVLSYRDLMDNTVLHLAAYTNQPQVIKRLVTKVPINWENSKGMTALDIIMQLPNDRGDGRAALQILQDKEARKGSSTLPTCADVFGSPINVTDKLYKLGTYLDIGLSWELRNAVMVVAVLIITATYQAVLSPPGGIGDDKAPVIFNPTSLNITSNITTTNNRTLAVILNTTTTLNITSNTTTTNNKTQQQEDDTNGKVAMPKTDFQLFISLNSIALATSMALIFLMLPTHLFNVLLYVSLVCLMVGYKVALNAISPLDKAKTISDMVVNIIIICHVVPLKIVNGLWRGKLRTMKRLMGSNNYYNINEVKALVFHTKYSRNKSDG